MVIDLATSNFNSTSASEMASVAVRGRHIFQFSVSALVPEEAVVVSLLEPLAEEADQLEGVVSD